MRAMRLTCFRRMLATNRHSLAETGRLQRQRDISPPGPARGVRNEIELRTIQHASIGLPPEPARASLSPRRCRPIQWLRSSCAVPSRPPFARIGIVGVVGETNFLVVLSQGHNPVVEADAGRATAQLADFKRGRCLLRDIQSLAVSVRHRDYFVVQYCVDGLADIGIDRDHHRPVY